MASDTLPFETTEAARTSAGAVTNLYSTGILLQGRTTGLAVILQMSDPGGGYESQCDAIVQTAQTGVLGSDHASWRDTNSRINGIVDAGTYSLQVTDPVMMQVRLRFSNTGDLDAAIRVRWLMDVAQATLLTS